MYLYYLLTALRIALALTLMYVHCKLARMTTARCSCFEKSESDRRPVETRVVTDRTELNQRRTSLRVNLLLSFHLLSLMHMYGFCGGTLFKLLPITTPNKDSCLNRQSDPSLLQLLQGLGCSGPHHRMAPHRRAHRSCHRAESAMILGGHAGKHLGDSKRFRRLNSGLSFRCQWCGVTGCLPPYPAHSPRHVCWSI